MRLDKYLKITRLIKRRGVAKVLIAEGSIQVNGKAVKPAYEVKPDDEIRLKLGRRVLTIKINVVKEVYGKENAALLYTIIYDELTTL